MAIGDWDEGTLRRFVEDVMGGSQLAVLVRQLQTTGGPWLYDEVATDQNRNAGTFADLATVGPQITIVNAGVYIVGIGAEAMEVTNGAQVAMSYSIAGAAASTADEARITTAANFYGTLCRMQRKTLGAGSSLVAKYLASSNNGQFRKRWIMAARLS